MKINVIFLKGGVSAMIGALAYLLGGWDNGIEALCIMVVADYATGLMKAIINKNLSSYIGFRGIFKKVCIFILVAVAVQIEKITNQNDTLHNYVAYCLIVNEGISILENAAEMGVPIPDVLKNLLKKMRSVEKKAVS
ncbi:MAG: phage holin family protein [Flavobacterium sp.]|nr:phage holin family protein [Flavobacterium sp.]